MNSRWRFVIPSVIAVFVLGAVLALGLAREQTPAKEDEASDQWEYLIVAGGNSNLSTLGNEQYPSGRKQPDTSFGREFFPLERNFDKLGAKGWELTAVHETRSDPSPIYFFKRRKK